MLFSHNALLVRGFFIMLCYLSIIIILNGMLIFPYTSLGFHFHFTLKTLPQNDIKKLSFIKLYKNIMFILDSFGSR